MTWVSVTLFCALTVAMLDVLCKRAANYYGIIFVSWIRFAGGFVFLSFLFFFIEIPKLSPDFFSVVAILVPIEISAIILYINAISISPLSATLPFLAFTPLFVTVTGYLVLGETISLFGLAGIALIVIGAYLINIHTIKGGIMRPLVSIYRERGSLVMLGVALLYSMTSVLGKKAILLSSVAFFGPFYVGVLSVAMIPIVLFSWRKRKKGGKKVEKEEGHIIFRRHFIIALIGIVAAMSYLAHFTAVSMTNVAYMIAVKRTSLLFGIVFGGLFFEEKYIITRLLGGAIMVSGSCLIIFSQ